MEYDLTLFSTVASASASFIAILGGLIASKLIAINSEKESVNNRLYELDKLIETKTEEKLITQKELDEDDATEYIMYHLDEIEKRTALIDVYEGDEQQRLSFSVLEEYWNIAISIYEKTCGAWSAGGKINSDGVPVGLAIELVNDEFAYNLCKEFVKVLDGTMWALINNGLGMDKSVEQYNEKVQEVDKLSSEIDLLQLQKEQVQKQKETLTNPPYMKSGISIFSGIIVLSILFPLVCMKIVPSYPCAQSCLENICIIFVAISLVLTVFYMCRLFKWKPAEKENKK